MSVDQVQGVLRHVLTLAAGLAISKGYMDEQTSIAIVGGIVAAVGFWLSVKAKQKTL